MIFSLTILPGLKEATIQPVVFAAEHQGISELGGGGKQMAAVAEVTTCLHCPFFLTYLLLYNQYLFAAKNYQIKQMNIYNQSRNRLTDIGKNLVVTSGERKEAK